MAKDDIRNSTSAMILVGFIAVGYLILMAASVAFFGYSCYMVHTGHYEYIEFIILCGPFIMVHLHMILFK